MKTTHTQTPRTLIRISGEHGRITRMTISGRSMPKANKTVNGGQ